MATHFLVKGVAEWDSYYQSLIVDAENEQSALRAAERYMEDVGATLLMVDPSETRDVASHPASWQEHSTPCGTVAAGGRLFILRRFATREFREVTSMEYAGVSARAMWLALEAFCRESGLIMAVTGASVPGAARLRSGLSFVYLIQANEMRALVSAHALLAEQRQRCSLFILPASEKDFLIAYSGLLSRPSRLRKAIVDRALCIIEEGDFLCRERAIHDIRHTLDRARSTESMRHA